MKELKKQLKNLIANNELDEAIELLLNESGHKGGNLQHIIIGLSSRYKRYKEKSLMGLEAREQELSQIIHDTLEVINVIDDPQPEVQPEVASRSTPPQSIKTPPQTVNSGSNKRKYLLIGALAGIGLIVLLSIIFSGGDSTSYPEDFSEQTSEQTLGTPSGEIEESGTDAYSGASPQTADLTGLWNQISQSWGEANDCSNCYIEVKQPDEQSLDLTGNNGWSAYLIYDDEEGSYIGSLDWGSISPQETDIVAAAYVEDGILTLATELKGREYILQFEKQ